MEETDRMMKRMKKCIEIEAKEISCRHPGLTKNNNRLFIGSITHYINLIKLIYSNGLYSLTNNEITSLKRQNILETATLNSKSPYQSYNAIFSSDISLFLKKYDKEILEDLKNWHKNLKSPEVDPQRKRLRSYLGDIVDVILKRQESSRIIIDIIVNQNINYEDMNIILNIIHKDDDLDYYMKYLKYISSCHKKSLVDTLCEKLVFQIYENAKSHLKKQDGFTQPSSHSTALNKNDNTPNISENNNISKNDSGSQLIEQKNNQTSTNGTINVHQNRKTKEVSSRHPGLTKNDFELFIKSDTHYIDLVNFIRFHGLYSLTNNKITLLSKQHIEEAMQFIFIRPDQQIKSTFSNNILIFLKKYNKEILDDIKNWDENEVSPKTDPQKKLLVTYINIIVHVLLKKQELSRTVIDILKHKKINHIDMNIILNDIHKDSDLNYYKNYLEYMLRAHYISMIMVLCKKLVSKLHKNATNHQNKEGFTPPLNQSTASNKNSNTPSINKNENVSKQDGKSELEQQKSAENTVDQKSQEKMVENYNKSKVIKHSSEIVENIISSTSVIKACESSQITSSQIIASVAENFENQSSSTLNNEIIIINDSDDELQTNVETKENNEDDDITSEIFNSLMNNEMLLEWDEIKDKHLIKFILDNPGNLQEDCTYNKLLMLKPKIFEGFKPENLRKRKDQLANNYEYLIKLCGFEKIRTEEEKVIFNNRIKSLRKLITVKIEVD